MPESADSTESGEGVEASPVGAEVTAAEIARLAGVGRAAVSNWRRRHADFPRPVGGTATSPSFALVEVEAWLRAQGKLAELPLAERVWQYLSGHPEGAATALVRAGCVLLLAAEEPEVREAADAADDPARALADALAPVLDRRFGTGRGRAVPAPEAAWFDAPTLTLVRAAAELAAGDGVAETYAFLLGRQLEAHPRQYAPTPEALAGLMAALAGPAPTVLDPACGSGGLLLAAEGASAVQGQEADGQLAALTALRLALRPKGARAVDVRAADTLRADALTGEAADAVLCHPPFNERNWGHDALAYDPRWEYGFPARTESELAWVQHCLARLRDGGTAVLLMPPAAHLLTTSTARESELRPAAMSSRTSQLLVV
ncbi:N-6 DNA methylase, partial [Streptomyces albidoflavus]